MIVEHQLDKELEADNYARNNEGNYVIISDRSAIEPAAYVGIQKISSILARYGKEFKGTRDNYDLVIHLTTAAKGASEFYTLENNDARNESISQAIFLDDSILKIWSNHPNRIIIDNNEVNFEEKMEKTKSIIINYLQKK